MMRVRANATPFTPDDVRARPDRPAVAGTTVVEATGPQRGRTGAHRGADRRREFVPTVRTGERGPDAR